VSRLRVGTTGALAMNSTPAMELRRHVRDPISRRAQVSYEGSWVPCLIQDMSTEGFGIMCTRPFSVGQICELKCEPYPGKEFQCQFEIRHTGDSHLGVMITEIDDTGRNLCMQLMHDYHSDRKARHQ
jgi:hypothetical protein